MEVCKGEGGWTGILSWTLHRAPQLVGTETAHIDCLIDKANVMKRIRDSIRSVIFEEYEEKLNWITISDFPSHYFSSGRSRCALLHRCSTRWLEALPHPSHLTAAVYYEHEFILTLSMLKRFCLFHQVQKTVVRSHTHTHPFPSHFRGQQSSVL